MNLTNASHDQAAIRKVLLETRRRGERLISYVRLGLAAVSLLGLVAAKLGGSLAAAVFCRFPFLLIPLLAFLLSGLVIFLAGRGHYRRYLSFVSTGFSVSALSVTIAVALGRQAALGTQTVALLAYCLYFLVILLCMRRYDPACCLFTGVLAASQYLLVTALLGVGLAPLVGPAPWGGSGGWPAHGFYGRVIETLLLLASGLLIYLLCRHASRQLLRVARVTGQLEMEEAYLMQFFDSTPEAIVLCDLQTRVLRINTAFTRLFGYSDEEARGRPIDELVVPPDHQEEGARLSREALAGQGVLLETVRRRRDGSLVDVSLSFASVVHHAEQVAIFGAYTDISERRRRERLLAALNQAGLAMQGASTHQEITEAVAGELERLGFSWSLLLLDEGGETLSVNRLGFGKVVVRAAERLLGARVSALRVPVDCHADVEAVIRRRETRYVAEPLALVEGLLPPLARPLAGRLIQLLSLTRTIGAPLLDGERVRGVLSVHSPELSAEHIPAVSAFAHQLSAFWRTVTLIDELQSNLQELRRTQAQLFQAQKMEAVGRLAGGIAHDFNNLLTVVRGYSELALAASGSEGLLAENLREILKAGEQATRLTEQLLAFSRKQVLQPQVLDLNGIVSGMHSMLKRVIGEDVELRTHLEEALPPVKVDPVQIQQVIMNLAVNARDAMPGGGRLNVETSRVEPGEAFRREHPEVASGPYVVLSMRDTGHGIPPEVLPHIFEPFYTTKERGRGTGLGLSTVYGIVKQSRGYVYARSEPGGGAAFDLYLPPVDEEIQAAGDPRGAAVHPAGGERVLLVEDEETVRRYAQTVLEGHGYQVITAGTAAEALAFEPSRLEDLRVLVSDVIMPGLDGRVLAERLQERIPGLAVVLMSGYAEQLRELPRTPEARHILLLRKPFNRRELLEVLQKALAG